MSEPIPYGKRWRQFIRLKDFPVESQIFDSKRDAKAWRDARTAELKEQGATGPGKRTLNDLLDRYIEHAMLHQKAGINAATRLNALKTILPTNKLLKDLTTNDFAEFRDTRKKMGVANGTIIKELTLISAAFNRARDEWGWLTVNPVSKVKRPEESPGRARIISGDEIQAMIDSMGHAPGEQPKSQSAQCALIFLIALETGMRAQEICFSEWQNVYLDQRYLHLPAEITKTATPRDVPLSQKAIDYIKIMQGFDDKRIFTVDPPTLDTLFRKHKKRCNLEGFTFHDSRHTAATRIVAEKNLNPLTLAKMFGWANPKQAMIYYNPTASEIAALL